MKSVLKDWVMKLPLRHQGVLVAAVRGCDASQKDDATKMLSRAYREVIMNAFIGDPAKSKSFIEKVSREVLHDRFLGFKKGVDPLPHHFVMHFIHAASIVGYKHPDEQVAADWRCFYFMICAALHMNPETEAELDERLTRDEEAFFAHQ